MKKVEKMVTTPKSTATGKSIKFIFTIFFLAGLFSNTVTAAAQENPYKEQDSVRIFDPVFGKPAFWLRQGSDAAEIHVSVSETETTRPAGSAEEWEVWLTKANGHDRFSVSVPVTSVEKTGATYILKPSIPSDIPVDLYDLQVSLTSNDVIYDDTEPHAVKIIETIKDRYSIVHLTDIHVDDIRSFIFNCYESEGYKVIKKAIEMVNLLNPEFAVITGDVVFGVGYEWEYEHLYSVMLGFDVPVFMTIGNHDAINHDWQGSPERIDGMKAFNDLFAPVTYRTTYGTTEFFALNSMDWTPQERLGLGIINFNWYGQLGEDQLSWFEDELAMSDAELRLVGFHHPPENSFAGTGAQEFMETARTENIDAVLTGHTHADEVHSDGTVLYLTTASVSFAGLTGGYPAFRILEIEDSELVSWNYQEPRWSVPIYRDSQPYGPVWLLREAALEVSYSPENNGTATTLSATITNHLEKKFSNISLEFVMPRSGETASYKVLGGTIEETYRTASNEIVYVNAAVAANDSSTITVSPSYNPAEE